MPRFESRWWKKCFYWSQYKWWYEQNIQQNHYYDLQLKDVEDSFPIHTEKLGRFINEKKWACSVNNAAYCWLGCKNFPLLLQNLLAKMLSSLEAMSKKIYSTLWPIRIAPFTSNNYFLRLLLHFSEKSSRPGLEERKNLSIWIKPMQWNGLCMQQ